MSFENTDTPKHPEFTGGYKVLGDEDVMPQKGKFKDVKMKDVPAWYLLFLSDNDLCSKSVRKYITDNWDRLCKEVGRFPSVTKKPNGTRETPVKGRWRG